MTTKFRFSGGKELEKALAQLAKPATRMASARRALKKAAQPIADKAESLAPARTGGPEKTFKKGDGSRGTRQRGALKMHVNVSERLSKRQARLNRKMGKSEVEVHVGTRDRIGRLVEFGTTDAPAQPYFRPAWDAEGGQKAVDRIAAEMWIDIDKTAARQAKRNARK